ncbi:MAG: TraR/DksA C4-type zinc finger protein [Ferruginibacter sp.]
MATKKPAAKKPAPKKVAAKPVKKAAPAKKPAAKPAPKKAVKPVAKAVAKKPVAKKPAPKPVKKAAPTPVAKKKAPVKPPVKAKAVKPVAKPIVKKIAKPTVTPATKKPAAVQKPLVKPMAKKEEVKNAVPKTVEKAVAPKAAAKSPKDIKIAPSKPVVIPKINHKDSRKYQPEFTKSVLDQLKHDPGQSIVRYNDNDLAEFRELIQRKLGSAKKELSYLQGLITRKDEMGGDESDNRYMTMEDGSLSMEREQLSQMASRQITFIDHLEKALMRIENKTYGICRVTGKLIDKARLRAVPHATLSIEAKMGIAK